KGSMVKKEVS
ncbi:nef attachable domain protein, partial [Chlamydia psittaci 02DC14]